MAHIFSALMESGEPRQEDSLAAAAEFYRPVFMLLHICDSFEEAKPRIRTHVEQFRKNYGL